MGAVAILEDEIAARKGVWRRQRQRESDVEKRVAALQQVRANFNIERFLHLLVRSAQRSLVTRYRACDAPECELGVTPAIPSCLF